MNFKSKLFTIVLSLTLIVTFMPMQNVDAKVKTKATVSTQSSLKRALKNKKLKTIVIKTSKSKTFTVPKGTHKKVQLIFNAPKSTLRNSSVFKKIKIEKIKVSSSKQSYIEYAKGNTISLYAKSANIGISKYARVNEIRNYKSGSSFKFVTNGELIRISAYAKSSIKITGNTKKQIAVYIGKNANGSSVTSNVASTTLIDNYKYLKPAQVTGLKVVERHDPIPYQVGSGTYGSPVTISWNKVSKAQKYEVGFQTGSNDWQYKTTTNTSIKINELSLYCKYNFKVRGIYVDEKGEWSETIYTYTKPLDFEIDFPDLSSNALSVSHRGMGSLTINWAFDEPEIDDIIDYSRIKYNVYCSVDQENWTLVGEELEPNTRSFTKRGCDPGVVYYFKVEPIDNTSYKTFTVRGAMSNVVSAEAELPDGLEIEQHYTTHNDEYILNRSFNLRGLVLHSVGGNIQRAEEWFNLYDGVMRNTSSVHGFIDGYTGVLWQTLPWEVRAGHAGAAGNNRYIGIEMCESKWLKYSDDAVTFTVETGHEKDARDCAAITYNSAVKLFAFLCDYYGLNPLKKGVIVSHYEWGTEYYDISGGGHSDPEHYWSQLGTDYTMDGFRAAVNQLLNEEEE